MVRAEIELARRFASKNEKPHTLPVRVAFQGPLPHPLDAYLNPIQYATWEGEESTAGLL